MPARTINKKLPPASKRKRLLHAFYLAQPFLQFFALMAVLFVLGRCSPLSPSTDKSKLRTFSDNGVKANEQSQSQADEIDINASLAELADFQSVELISSSELQDLSVQSVHADTPADEVLVNSVFRRRGAGNPRVKLLVLPFPGETDRIISQGAIRVDIAQRMSRMNDQVRNSYFRELKRVQNKKPTVYFVVTDAALQKFADSEKIALKPRSSIVLPHLAQVLLGFPKEGKAYVKLISKDKERRTEREAKLLKSVIELGPTLAVVLE